MTTRHGGGVPASVDRARTSVLASEVTGNGPVVVCLHGQPGSGSDWASVRRALGDSVTVVSVDRPGYGRSGVEATGFAANAEAVLATLDDLGIDRAVMVGHSWGGGVALALAEDHPARVNGLVLVASVGPGGAPGLLDRVLAAPVVGDVVAASTFAMAGTLMASAAVRAGLERYLPGASVSALAALNGSRPGDDPDRHRPRLRGTDALWRSFVVEQRAFVAELDGLGPGLSDVEVPVAVMVGTADRVVDPGIGAHLARSIPGATLVEIPGGGHLLPFDHAADVAASILDIAGTLSP